MRFASLLVAALPFAAHAEGLDAAKGALETGRAALRTSPAECRLALDSNIGIALRDLEAGRAEQAKLFVSGLSFAATFTSCPTPVTKALKSAEVALKDVKDSPPVAAVAGATTVVTSSQTTTRGSR